jgi:acetyltransferase-like isoleucine patch superfamily enzyme
LRKAAISLLKYLYHLVLDKWIVLKLRKNNMIGRNVRISRHAKIGMGCKIGNNVTIAGDVELGNNVVVGSGVRLEKITLGDNSIFEGRAFVTGSGVGHITVGSNSLIGNGTVLDWSGGITIGNFVQIGYAHVYSHSSVKIALKGLSIGTRGLANRPTAAVVIEDNVWIGGFSYIYPGIVIGHHSIVVPNSLVTESVIPYSMVGGDSAKFIKSTKQLCGDRESTGKSNHTQL